MRLDPATPADSPVLCRLISLAFGTPADKVQEWLDNAGVHNFRVMRDAASGSGGAEVLACALRVPMGHFYGGTSVPAIGVAGVAVAPEHRGRGLATIMMDLLMREVHAEGVPLSTLYPATLPLYRRVGFEQAGYWCEYHIPLHRIALDRSPAGGGADKSEEKSLIVRAYNPDTDRAAVTRCYSTLARANTGMLDRGDYVWGRIFKPRQGETTGLVVETAGGSRDIVGYVFFRQERNPDYKHDVILSDIAATAPAAGRRLLDLLSDFRSVGNDLIFHGGPLHPLVPLLDEQKLKCTIKEYWMLRVTDVPAALTTRAYNPHITTAFTLDVTDETIAQNAGPWSVTIEAGKAHVSRGVTPGSPILKLHTRALAALYSGFMTPQHLRMLGRLEASDDAMTAATMPFAGPVPSLQDMY